MGTGVAGFSVVGAIVTFFLEEVVVHADAVDRHFVVDDAVTAGGPATSLSPGEIGDGAGAGGVRLRTGTSCIDGTGGFVPGPEVTVFAEGGLDDAVATRRRG